MATLEEDEVEVERVGRRSAVSRLGGTLLGSLAALVGATRLESEADRDSGPSGDPRPRPTPPQDEDRGPNADRPGR